MNIISILDTMLENLERDYAIAKNLSSSNVEDSIYIKMSIVAFTYNCSQNNWNYDMLCLINNSVNYEFVQTVNAIYDDIHILAYCYLHGYLLGMIEGKLMPHNLNDNYIGIIHGFLLANFERIRSYSNAISLPSYKFIFKDIACRI